MRKALILLAGLAVLAFANFGIFQRERLVTQGEIVLLRLSPVDPRSLMQGDYMRLNFDVADRAFPPSARFERTGIADGHIVVALDDHRVGHFRRFADGKPLAGNERALRYRVRNGDPYLATNAFFFQEGTGRLYEPAQYGEFRVDGGGDMILTALRDDRFRRLPSRS